MFKKNKLLLPPIKYKYIVDERYQLKWVVINHLIEKYCEETKLNILDVGCGFPNILSTMIDSGNQDLIGNYTGIDKRKGMIDFLKENYADCNWIKEDFMQMDLDCFKENEFNVLAICGPEINPGSYPLLLLRFIPFLKQGGLFISDNSPGPKGFDIEMRYGESLISRFKILEGCNFEINHIPVESRPYFPNVHKRTITVMRKI